MNGDSKRLRAYIYVYTQVAVLGVSHEKHLATHVQIFNNFLQNFQPSEEEDTRLSDERRRKRKREVSC